MACDVFHDGLHGSRLAIAGKAARNNDTAGEPADAKDTAKALQLLQAAGAAIRGRTKTEELHFGWDTC